MDKAKLAVLGHYAHELEATPVLAALAAAKIQATSSGEFTAAFRAEAAGEVVVWVLEHDLDRAVDVVQKAREVDWDNVDVGEPDDHPLSEIA